jgi:hypothetical protein
VKSRLGFLSASGAVVAAVAVVGVVGISVVKGPVLFSPGGLSAMSKGHTYGGVSSHAQIKGCGSCHSAPWSSQTMADKCLACHTDVASQMQSGSGIHAQMAGSVSSPTCKGCHTDHHGPNGTTTFFDHSKTSFKLTGAHTKVACNLCHGNATSLQDFRNAPTTCYGCHAKNDPHKGSFGQQCDQCHNTSSWAGANFKHDIIPVNHGTDQQASTCQTCHPNGTGTYTCYGCHRHTPANVQSGHEGQSAAQLADCIRCHKGGKVHD